MGPLPEGVTFFHNALVERMVIRSLHQKGPPTKEKRHHMTNSLISENINTNNNMLKIIALKNSWGKKQGQPGVWEGGLHLELSLSTHCYLFHH